MPRRLPVRPAKVFGNLFVLLVLSVIALVYYTFVFVVWGPRADSKYQLLNLLINSYKSSPPDHPLRSELMHSIIFKLINESNS